MFISQFKVFLNVVLNLWCSWCFCWSLLIWIFIHFVFYSESLWNILHNPLSHSNFLYCNLDVNLLHFQTLTPVNSNDVIVKLWLIFSFEVLIKLEGFMKISWFRNYPKLHFYWCLLEVKWADFHLNFYSNDDALLLLYYIYQVQDTSLLIMFVIWIMNTRLVSSESFAWIEKRH